MLIWPTVKLLGSSLSRACHLDFLSHTNEFDAAQQITMGAATALMLVADGGYSIA
ncbi:hypothetical protein [Caballeronia sp. KNU42]